MNYLSTYITQIHSLGYLSSSFGFINNAPRWTSRWVKFDNVVWC